MAGRYMSPPRKLREIVKRVLHQDGAGDVQTSEISSRQGLGPSGPTVTLDYGGGRTAGGVAASSAAIYPGTLVTYARPRRNSLPVIVGLAPKQSQPTEPSQTFTADPAGFYTA